MLSIVVLQDYIVALNHFIGTRVTPMAHPAMILAPKCITGLAQPLHWLQPTISYDRVELNVLIGQHILQGRSELKRLRCGNTYYTIKFYNYTYIRNKKIYFQQLVTLLVENSACNIHLFFLCKLIFCHLSFHEFHEKI